MEQNAENARNEGRRSRGGIRLATEVVEFQEEEQRKARTANITQVPGRCGERLSEREVESCEGYASAEVVSKQHARAKEQKGQAEYGPSCADEAKAPSSRDEVAKTEQGMFRLDGGKC